MVHPVMRANSAQHGIGRPKQRYGADEKNQVKKSHAHPKVTYLPEC
jgi:predicted ArsR family transcriptional regulator